MCLGEGALRRLVVAEAEADLADLVIALTGEGGVELDELLAGLAGLFLGRGQVTLEPDDLHAADAAHPGKPVMSWLSHHRVAASLNSPARR
jgi:ABC-type cobalamin transport system ATPase subunit